MYQIKEYSHMNINKDFVIDHRELSINILSYVPSSHIITQCFFFASYVTRKLLFTLLFTILFVISNMTLNCAYLYIIIL